MKRIIDIIYRRVKFYFKNLTAKKGIYYEDPNRDFE